MPTPLIISEADIAPLLNDPAMMDGAIEACENATVAEYQGRVRSTNIIDRTTEHERANLLQIHFSAQDSLVTGFQTDGHAKGLGDHDLSLAADPMSHTAQYNLSSSPPAPSAGGLIRHRQRDDVRPRRHRHVLHSIERVGHGRGLPGLVGLEAP